MNRSSRLHRFLLLPVLVLAAGAALFGYLLATRIQAHPEPARERVWPVTVVAVALSDVQPSLSAFGAIVASRSIDLKPQVPGRLVFVAEALVDGATVAAGELLAQVDPFDYERALAEARARLAEARARLQELEAELTAARTMLGQSSEQLALRERDLERARSLKDRGSMSAKARDDAELAVLAAREQQTRRRQDINALTARIAQQQAGVDRLASELQRAERNLQDTRVIAPFDGHLSEVDAALGKRVRDGDRLARLVAADALEASFELSARQVAGLLAEGPDSLIGRPVIVRWQLGAQRFDYSGRLARTGAEIDPTSGGIRVHATLDPRPPGDPLRPGAFVSVSLPDRIYRGVARVPAEAVTDDRVFVVEDERLALRQVQVLRRVGDDLLVRGDLVEGDRLVTTRFPEAGPGARVRSTP